MTNTDDLHLPSVAALSALYDTFESPSTEPTSAPVSTPIPTRSVSSSSSSSSSTCTHTATSTPIVIVTTSDTTAAQFDAFVESLPATSKPQTFPSTDGHSWLVATLNQCTSEALWKDSRVAAMCIDSPIVSEDDVDPLSSLPLQDFKRDVPSRPRSNDTEYITSRQAANSPKVVLTDKSHVLTQTNAPVNLDWISALSQQTTLTGNYYDFENYLFDDGEAHSVQAVPWIYYIDGTGFALHAVGDFLYSTCPFHPIMDLRG